MTSSEIELRNTFEQMVKMAIAVGIAKFGDDGLPTFDADCTWARQTAPGKHTLETNRVQQADWWGFWNGCEDNLKSCTEWEAATNAYQAFEQLYGTEPEDGQPGDRVCEVFLENYLDDVGRLEFVKSIFDEVVVELIERAIAETSSAITVIAAEHLSASSPFELASGIHVRHIEREELELFGEGLRPTSRFIREIPHDDWWVVKITGEGAKGTTDGQNAAFHDSVAVAPALRTFKEGRLTFRHENNYMEGRFAERQFGRSTAPQQISRRGDPYSLSVSEIDDLKAFWPPFKSLMESDHHYLQLPVRRLLSGGDRPNLEDSLVDYAVGLESLLADSAQRSELRYRFGVRGAVLISDDPKERPDNFKKMKQLYDLRSDIVHSNKYDATILAASVDFAEMALRKCWHWSFEDWRDRANNSPAVEEIDRQLFLTS